MSLKPEPSREMPPDIAAWGAKVLQADDLYRRIGDTLYAEIHALFAEELADIPTPVGLTPINLAIILAFQELERLTAGAAANDVYLGWKYALHLPRDHYGCSGYDRFDPVAASALARIEIFYDEARWSEQSGTTKQICKAQAPALNQAWALYYTEYNSSTTG